MSNIATVMQTGNQGKAFVNQSSNSQNNTAFINTGVSGMFNALPADSYAIQNGSGNKMTITQMATGATATIFNTASLSQTGTGNMLTVDQTISTGALGGNMATATQTGMNNQAIVQQTAMPQAYIMNVV